MKIQLGLIFALILLMGCTQLEPTQPILLNVNEEIIMLSIDRRVVVDGDRFIDSYTEEIFIPRGYNFTELGVLDNTCTLPGELYHNTFSSSSYDELPVTEMFKKLENAGYNMVRVFLNPECLSVEKDSFQPAYMANLVDFLQQAKQYDIYVILTLDMIPSAWYGNEINKIEDIDWINTQFLDVDMIAAEVDFWQDFILALHDEDAKLEMIFSYELRNELYFHPDYEPVSLWRGEYVLPNGESYALSDETEKSMMVNDGFVYWSQRIRDAIHAIDPSALVSCGFFAPDPFGDVGKYGVHELTLDFVDLHFYPQDGVSILDYAAHFQLDHPAQIPLLMGEYGVVETDRYTPTEALEILRDWMRESCEYGFDGWLLWDYTKSTDIPLSLVDDGTLFEGLSPDDFPNSCQ